MVLRPMMVTRLQMLSGVRGVMIGSCVDVTTLLARAFAPGKASALLSFNEGRLQPRLDRGGATVCKPDWSILPMTLA
jgi:hypothetical protein